MIPFEYNGADQYFCTEIKSQFKCKTIDAIGDEYSVCTLGILEWIIKI